MNTEINRSTVLVIYDTNKRYEFDSVRDWFESSPMNSLEAIDIFDAMEKIADFTCQTCPDVVLLRVAPGSTAGAIVEQFQCDPFDPKMSIAILSDVKSADETQSFSFGSLAHLKDDLDAIYRPTRRLAAAGDA